jgi:hypothetical protein
MKLGTHMPDGERRKPIDIEVCRTKVKISFLRYCAETKKLTPGRPAAGTPGRPDNIHHIISRVLLRRNSAKNTTEQFQIKCKIKIQHDNWKSSQEAKSISTKTVFNLTISIT